MKISTMTKMIEYASKLPPSTNRAQCYTIADYTLQPNETIAMRIERDHASEYGVQNAAQLMVEAGAATKEGGRFTFEDGYTLN